VLTLTTCRRDAVGADRLVQARAGHGRVTRFDGSDMTMPDSRFPVNLAAAADDLRVIAAETAKPLGDTTAVPGATIFVTCSSTAELARHESFTLWAQTAVARLSPERPGWRWPS
jgi:hypothetical protein